MWSRPRGSSQALKDQISQTQVEMGLDLATIQARQAALEKVRSDTIEMATRVKLQLAGYEASVKTAQTARDQREAEKKAEVEAKAKAEAEVAELTERAFPAHGAADQADQRVPDDPRIEQAAGRSPAQVRRSPGPARLVRALSRRDRGRFAPRRRTRADRALRFGVPPRRSPRNRPGGPFPRRTRRGSRGVLVREDQQET